MSNYSDALFDAHQQVEEWKRRHDEAVKAAGDLLRAAKEAFGWLLECDQNDDAQKLYAAIEAAERAGVR